MRKTSTTPKFHRYLFQMIGLGLLEYSGYVFRMLSDGDSSPIPTDASPPTSPRCTPSPGEKTTSKDTTTTFPSPIRQHRPLHRPFSPLPSSSPSCRRSLSPGEVVRGGGGGPSSPLQAPHGVIHPTVTHPMWPYLYHSSLHPGSTLPFSVGQMLLGGTSNPGFPHPFFNLTSQGLATGESNNPTSSPLSQSAHASWASHLALTNPVLYQHYAAAISQAAAAAAVAASISPSGTTGTTATTSATTIDSGLATTSTSSLNSLPLSLQSSPLSSPSIGPLLSSSRLPTRFTPYTLPLKKTPPPQLPPTALLSPHDDPASQRPPSELSQAASSPSRALDDEERASPSPTAPEATRSPLGGKESKVPSELRSMERMVCGLERQQEQLVTDSSR